LKNIIIESNKAKPLGDGRGGLVSRRLVNIRFLDSSNAAAALNWNQMELEVMHRIKRRL
jgi:hypothetical protein